VEDSGDWNIFKRGALNAQTNIPHIQTLIPHIANLVKPSYPSYGACIIYQTIVFVKYVLYQNHMTNLLKNLEKCLIIVIFYLKRYKKISKLPQKDLFG